MVAFKPIKDVEKVILILMSRGKPNGEKYIHCSDHIEISYELENGEMEYDDNIEDVLDEQDQLDEFAKDRFNKPFLQLTLTEQDQVIEMVEVYNKERNNGR